MPLQVVFNSMLSSSCCALVQRCSNNPNVFLVSSNWCCELKLNKQMCGSHWSMYTCHNNIKTCIPIVIPTLCNSIILAYTTRFEKETKWQTHTAVDATKHQIWLPFRYLNCPWTWSLCLFAPIIGALFGECSHPSPLDLMSDNMEGVKRMAHAIPHFHCYVNERGGKSMQLHWGFVVCLRQATM